jgi:hypothetical protein
MLNEQPENHAVRAIIAMPSQKFFGGEFMLFCKKKSLWKTLRIYFFSTTVFFQKNLSTCAKSKS